MSRENLPKLALSSIGGLVSGVIVIGLSEAVLWIYSPQHPVNYWPMLLQQMFIATFFAIFYISDVPMRWATDKKTKNILIKHLTFVNTSTAGLTGNAFILSNLPPECNALPIQFWFSMGLIFFFAASATVWNIAIYGLIYLLGTIWLIQQNGDFSNDEKMLLLSWGFQIFCFSPVAVMASRKIGALKHAFRQLGKVFYPHQLSRIKRGFDIESTMPTHASHACVICLDIISSSKLQHMRTKDFLQNFFKRCNEIMMQGYDGAHMISSGYRVKEMGDGFLCSVGYPFHALTDNLAESAVRMALQFHRALVEESKILDLEEPVRCGIGIAHDQVVGFYPQSGAKEYDLFGRALVLANRYQALRRIFQTEDSQSSFLILQEKIYSSLTRDQRSCFECISLQDIQHVVRDDNQASKFYLMRLHADANAAQRITSGAGSKATA